MGEHDPSEGQKGESLSDKTTRNQLQSEVNVLSSKQNTLFDCIIATVARKYSAGAIFSFDKWYTKIGFTLASEIYT